MATTLEPARPFPGAGKYPLDTGTSMRRSPRPVPPRHSNARVRGALARHDLVALRERVRSHAAGIGLGFGPGRPIAVDPVPRLIDGAEWEALEAGRLQRARALNAFLAG